MGASDGQQRADDLDTDPPIPTEHVFDWEPVREAPPPLPTEIEIEAAPWAGDDVVRIAHTPDDLDLHPPEPTERIFDTEAVRYDPPMPNQIEFEPFRRDPVEERVVIHDYEVVRFDSAESSSDHGVVVHGILDDGSDAYDAMHDDVTHEVTHEVTHDGSADSPDHACVEDTSGE